MKQKGKIIADENEESINVNFGIYKQYFMNYMGGILYFLLFNVSLTIVLLTNYFNSFWIGEWTKRDSLEEQ